MTYHDLRYEYDGGTYRVVVAGDVVALPEHRWALGGFGTGISVDWMLDEGRLPGNPYRRNLLAELVVRALADVHGGTARDCRAFRRVP